MLPSRGVQAYCSVSRVKCETRPRSSVSSATSVSECSTTDSSTTKIKPISTPSSLRWPVRTTVKKNLSKTQFSKCRSWLVIARVEPLSVTLPFFLILPHLSFFFFLLGEYFSINLEPSYFVTQPIIFGDFIKVKVSFQLFVLRKPQILLETTNKIPWNICLFPLLSV